MYRYHNHHRLEIHVIPHVSSVLHHPIERMRHLHSQIVELESSRPDTVEPVLRPPSSLVKEEVEVRLSLKRASSSGMTMKLLSKMQMIG